jgi:hypothetical protein
MTDDLAPRRSETLLVDCRERRDKVDMCGESQRGTYCVIVRWLALDCQGWLAGQHRF